MRITVREHIMNYMRYLMVNNIATFKTSDIQNLSERSVKFVPGANSRLGSPGTYERTFRELRKNGLITVTKQKEFKKQRQASWYLKNIGETNENKS